MLNTNAFAKARESHAVDTNKVLNHLKNCPHLKIKNVTIKLNGKKSVVEQIKEEGLDSAKGVYAFFVDKNKIQTLQENLCVFRANRPNEMKKRQAVPFPNQYNEAKNGCLYVGMVREKNLQHRILEHLTGTLSARTGALKLHLWGKGLREIKLSYIVFSNEDELGLIEEYEKAIWKYYQPAIGKL